MNRNEIILNYLRDLMMARIARKGLPYLIVDAARDLADICASSGSRGWREPISRIDLQQMITLSHESYPRAEVLAVIMKHGSNKPIGQQEFLKAQFVDLAHHIGRQAPELVALEQEHRALERDLRICA